MEEDRDHHHTEAPMLPDTNRRKFSDGRRSRKSLSMINVDGRRSTEVFVEGDTLEEASLRGERCLYVNDKWKVLREGPWASDKSFLLMGEIDGKQPTNQIQLKHSFFWFHVREYIWLRVVVDVIKPLLRGKKICIGVKALFGHVSPMRDCPIIAITVAISDTLSRIASLRGGGLAQLWLASVDITIQSYSSNHIDAVLKDVGRNKVCFFMMGVYVHPDATQRRMMDDCLLRDLGYNGEKFTWCNWRDGTSSVLERLDRAVANLQWCTSFPQAVVIHGCSPYSDHILLWLEVECIDEKMKWSKKMFRFEAMWVGEEECKNIVDRVWNMGGDRTCRRRSDETDF
ncbi:unnamed protein product [Fraxinus pennsylvanica]|uniref:Uncharacterized protein n=1 Tax=Fraxinus pennsylvanica TaxID=56036 RepID=A0AAD1ZSZ6_9LAMI|nr:unnamed protein product [Fraxinus pennsylvanica]